MLYLFVFDTVVTGTLIVGGVIGNSLAFVVFWKDTITTSVSFLFHSMELVDSALLLLVISLFTIFSFLTYTNWLTGYSDLVPYLYVYIQPLALMARKAFVWIVIFGLL